MNRIFSVKFMHSIDKIEYFHYCFVNIAENEKGEKNP